MYRVTQVSLVAFGATQWKLSLRILSARVALNCTLFYKAILMPKIDLSLSLSLSPLE